MQLRVFTSNNTNQNAHVPRSKIKTIWFTISSLPPETSSHLFATLQLKNIEVTKSLHDLSHLGVEQQQPPKTSTQTPAVRSSRAASASGRTLVI